MKELQPEELEYILQARGIDDLTYTLQHAPTGWKDSTVVWKRSLQYWGMMRDFTVPLDFVYEGAKIIRNEFYGFGYESLLKIFINRLNPKTWSYLPAYQGDIDLTTFNDTSNVVTVNAAEGGLSAKIKAYEGVDYEIDIDVPEAVEVELEGIILRESSVFIFYGSSRIDADIFPKLQLVEGLSDVKSVNFSTQNVDLNYITDPVFSDSSSWFFTANIDTTLEMTGFLNVLAFVAGSSPATLDISFYKNNSQAPLLTLYHKTLESGDQENVNIPLNYNIPMLKGERLFIYFDSSQDDRINQGFGIFDGEMNLKYSTISPPTKIKALRPIYVFQQLINKINGAQYPIRSSFLKKWEQVVLTSGDAVRGIAGAKLKTNFKDFFAAFNVIETASFGIQDNKATFESRQYWFNDVVKTFDFNDISDFTLNVNTDLLYSSVVIGYDDQTYDEVNGKQEVNSNQTWTLPVTRVQKALELISPYRADAYGIEFLRINLEGKTTTDSDSDNDVCMIKIDAQPVIGQTYYHVERFVSIENVLAGNTWYNADLTPKRCLLRQGAYLKSLLYKRDAYNIEFQSGLKNTSAKTLDNKGIKVVENEDINIGSLPAAYFIPYVVTFNAPIENEAQSQIDSFPTGRVDFLYRGNKFKGYILEMPVNMAQNTVQQIKLLLTADNDLSLLAR